MPNKRGDGEGRRITFRPKENRWYSSLSYGWKDGKRLRKSFYGRTAQEVQQKILKARTAHANGLPVVAVRESVGSFLQRWLTDVVKLGVRPRTYESYELTVRLHIIPTLGKIRLEKLTPQHVQALLSRKTEEGSLAPRSIA